MNTIQKRKRDLDQLLYVNLVNEWQSERPRRPRCNVIHFPTAAEQPEEKPQACGLTAGGTAAILLALLALAAVLILLGVTVCQD